MCQQRVHRRLRLVLSAVSVPTLATPDLQPLWGLSQFPQMVFTEGYLMVHLTWASGCDPVVGWSTQPLPRPRGCWEPPLLGEPCFIHAS